MPPEITQAVLNAMVVLIGGMGAFLTGLLITIGLRARASVKQQEIDLKKQDLSNKAAAEEKSLAIEREKLFMQQYADLREQVKALRDETRQQDIELRELHKQVVVTGAELEIVKEARATRERELAAANERASAAEAKLATAENRITELEKQVDDLKAKFVAAGLKDTREFPAVTPPVNPGTLSDLGLAAGQ